VREDRGLRREARQVAWQRRAGWDARSGSQLDASKVSQLTYQPSSPQSASNLQLKALQLGPIGSPHARNLITGAASGLGWAMAQHWFAAVPQPGTGGIDEALC